MITPAAFDEPLCAEIGSEIFFINDNGRDPAEAVKACTLCKHRIDCATYAIPYYNLDGLWGGLSPGARAQIRKDQGIQGKSVESYMTYQMMRPTE